MKEYAIYNREDELVFMGNAHKCSEFLKCSEDSFRCRVSRLSKGKVKNPKFRIYKVED